MSGFGRLCAEKPTGRVSGPELGRGATGGDRRRSASVLPRIGSNETDGEARPRGRGIENERALPFPRSEPTGSAAHGGGPNRDGETRDPHPDRTEHFSMHGVWSRPLARASERGPTSGRQDGWPAMDQEESYDGLLDDRPDRSGSRPARPRVLAAGGRTAREAQAAVRAGRLPRVDHHPQAIAVRTLAGRPRSAERLADARDESE